jgi:hypothetical protein
LVPTSQREPILTSVFLFVKKWHFCLCCLAIHWFPCDISMYICIVTPISSLLICL